MYQLRQMVRWKYRWVTDATYEQIEGSAASWGYSYQELFSLRHYDAVYLQPKESL